MTASKPRRPRVFSHQRSGHDDLVLRHGGGFGDDAAIAFAKVDPVPRELGHHRRPGTEFPGHKSPRREPGDCDVV